MKRAGFRGTWTEGRAESNDGFSPHVVRDAARARRVHGVVPGERAALVVATAVAGELGLPAIRDEAAITLVTRAALRERLSEGGIAQPEYRVVWTLEDAPEAGRALDTPLFVSGGNACTGDCERRVDHLEDLSLACTQVARSAQHAPIMLESELAGDVLGVFGFVNDERFEIFGIVQGDRAEPHRFLRNTSFPALVQPATRKRIEDICQRAVKTIGLDRGGVRFELVIFEDEPRVLDVDVCPFSPWMPVDLFELSGGPGFLEGCLRCSVGKEPQFMARRPGGAAVHWVNTRSGRVQGILGEDQARDIYGVVDVKLAAATGDVMGHVLDCASRDRVGYVVATGVDASAARDVASRGAEACKVVTQAVYDDAS